MQAHSRLPSVATLPVIALVVGIGVDFALKPLSIQLARQYSSRLNQIERWFALVTECAIRRNSITRVCELKQQIEWGVERSKVRQLDWWKSVQVFGLELVATPAQHFSGRGISDIDKTLWASWVMLDGPLRVFFSGDTGYFDGFKAIGEKYGPSTSR